MSTFHTVFVSTVNQPPTCCWIADLPPPSPPPPPPLAHSDSSPGASFLSLPPHLQRVVMLCVRRYWVVTRLVTGCVRARPCVRETYICALT